MNPNMTHEEFMQEAITLAKKGSDSNEGGPFGCIIVKDGRIIGRGNNRVTSTNDPTAHAEVVAIREATKNVGFYHLDGAVLYTSCEPCPMCLGAIYWAKIAEIYYANTRDDAAAIGFSDAFIYDEIGLPVTGRSIPALQICHAEALSVFRQWELKEDKITY